MTSRFLRLLCGLVVAVGALLPAAAGAQGTGKAFSNEQLDQMLAPIALYPDSLLAQVLMATTYPDEFQEAAAWSKANPDSKGDEAVKAVESKDWDPSVASLVAFPEVLITFGEKPEWVKNLGDAFLAQPEDVMNSVQRLRAAALKEGNLKSNEQQKVTTQPAEPKAQPAQTQTTQTTVVQTPAPTQTIIIEPAQPSVVYVPAYNPTVVYGPWWYPAYPPYYYPPPPGYWFSRAVVGGIAWGIGIGVTNALWGGCNWGRGDVNINVNRYNNINVNKRIDASGNRGNWSHDPSHRKADYRGGNATRQQLQSKHNATGREQYRGKDAGGDRDAARQRAQQTAASRGVEAPGGSARDRAQTMDRDAAQQRAQGVDRDSARQSAQAADRDAARQRSQAASRDNAFSGVDSSQARSQASRGAASSAAASRPSPSAASRPSPSAASRPSPSAASRPSPSAGARAGGGGGGRAGGGGGRGR